MFTFKEEPSQVRFQWDIKVELGLDEKIHNYVKCTHWVFDAEQKNKF
jgi:hypothetical protein